MSATSFTTRVCLVTLALAGALFLAAPDAKAITYGEPDCIDNATNTGCLHPNTVSVSGFRSNNTALQVCSGSLLTEDADRFIILTAGHCATFMLRLLQDGRIDHLGVSFDAHLFDRRRWRQYIHGGQAVLPKEFGPHGSLAWVLQFDYAVIVFELPRDARYTGNGRFVDLSGISPITLPEQDYLLDKVRGSAELPLTAVGYGMGEFLVGPGDASGATFDRSKEGDRWMAEYTSANSFMGREANILVGSQNPARGDEGTCYGDSGGPLFYEDQGVELQVAITSSGDFPCRSTAFMTRTDSARAVEFLGCVMAPGAELEDILACGCTEVNDARVCPGATGRGGRRGSRR